MSTNNFLIIIFGVVLTLTTLVSVESAAIRSGSNSNNTNNIVYQRYVRRRPPTQPNEEYMDEVVEIFHTKLRPPTVGNLMFDDEVDKFIYCDFNRELEECKTYLESLKTKRPTTPRKPNAPTPKKPVLAEATTSRAEQTTNKPSTTLLPTITTSTSNSDSLPHLPDIPVDIDDTETVNLDYEEDEDDQNVLKAEVEDIDKKLENDIDDYNEEDYNEENNDEDNIFT